MRKIFLLSNCKTHQGTTHHTYMYLPRVPVMPSIQASFLLLLLLQLEFLTNPLLTLPPFLVSFVRYPTTKRKGICSFLQSLQNI